jgi:hypothetical protein
MTNTTVEDVTWMNVYKLQVGDKHAIDKIIIVKYVYL